MTPGMYYIVSSFVQLAVFLVIYLGEHRQSKRVDKAQILILKALGRVAEERKILAKALNDLVDSLEEKGM